MSHIGIVGSVWFLFKLKVKAEVQFMTVTLQGDSREVVAVKVVAKKSLNKASTENLLTEIEMLKTIRHPHIVQLKDFQVNLSIAFKFVVVNKKKKKKLPRSGF